MVVSCTWSRPHDAPPRRVLLRAGSAHVRAQRRHRNELALVLLHHNRLITDESGASHTVPSEAGVRVDSQRVAAAIFDGASPERRPQMPYDGFLDELRGCKALDHQYNKTNRTKEVT